MPGQIESNAGVRWLSIFEGVAIILIGAAVIGITGVFINTQTTNSTLSQLVLRFDRMEESTDNRFIRLEDRVTDLEKNSRP